MVIIHVMGGLGNQLYQYALYEKFKLLGREAKLDLYAYTEAQGDEREWRELELCRLGLCYDVCTRDERRRLLDNGMAFSDRVRRKLTGRRDRTVRESADYMPEIFDMDDVYLYGFWGCERYYIDIVPLLREKIVFPESKDPRNAELMQKMGRENSVGLHIRRQDYLTVADGKRYMGICTDEYYAGAMDYIRGRVDNPVFYIFSDDARYARAHFGSLDVHVVDWNTGADSMYDMELMSRCRHNVCANSTFSMWGARLNKNAEKIMIRPLHHDNYEVCGAAAVRENWPGWILIDNAGKCV